MCRSIKTLFNFKPPATDEEIRAASLTAHALLDSLQTSAEPRDREIEAARARARAAERFGTT